MTVNPLLEVVRYQTRVRRLRRRGVRVDLLRQLWDAGPDALPQVIVLENATPEQIAALNAGVHR